LIAAILSLCAVWSCLCFPISLAAGIVGLVSLLNRAAEEFEESPS
jgi:hypothetical protein